MRSFFFCLFQESPAFLLSLVILGATADDVLPCHSNKIYNLIVVVIGQQRFGRNEPQVDLLNLRLGFLLEGRGGTAVDAATAATTTGHGLVVETSMNIATAVVVVAAARAVGGATQGRGIATGSGCVVHCNRWHDDCLHNRYRRRRDGDYRWKRRRWNAHYGWRVRGAVLLGSGNW